jgi:hypothetical protein
VEALCPANVVELLVLAEKCSRTELRTEGLNYTKTNVTAVLKEGNFIDLPGSVAKDVVKTPAT